MRDSLIEHDRFPSESGLELWAADVEGAPGEVKPAEIEGWAVTYRDTPNYSGRILVPGAFTDSLTRRPTKRKPLPMGYEHSSFQGTNVVGRWTAAEDQAKGLLLKEGKISQTSLGRDVRTLVDDGVITGLSIGFLARDTKMGEAGEEYTFDVPGGKRTYRVEEPTMFVLHGELMETSLVSAPADDEARMAHLQTMRQATRALPGLRDDAEWEQVAYSMALLMGGRGAGRDFRDLGPLDRQALYLELASAYERLDKTPPPYDPDPEYRSVEFAHDEREVFQQRYVAKTLATASSGLAGLDGPLSREGCAMAMKTARALLPLLDGPLPDEAKELAREFQRVLGPQLDATAVERARDELAELVAELRSANG